MDRVGGQRGRKVASSNLDWTVTDGEQAVAGLDRVADMRGACLPVVDAEVMRERLVDHTFCRVNHRYWYLHLLSQRHKLGCDAEPVSICINQDRRRFGGRQSRRDGGDARTQPLRVARRVGEDKWSRRNLDVEVGDVG